MLTKVAVHQAAAGAPTVILDPRSNIRGLLDDDTTICCHDIAKLARQRETNAHFPTCRALLLYAEYPYPSMADLTAAAEDAIRNLQLTADRLNAPGLLIADQYHVAADIDWNHWTDRTQIPNIHTVVSTVYLPTSGIKRPIPVIANADAIILRTTSDSNLVPVMANSDIDDDLSLMTDVNKSLRAGYLWLRDPRWSAFFADPRQ